MIACDFLVHKSYILDQEFNTKFVREYKFNNYFYNEFHEI